MQTVTYHAFLNTTPTTLVIRHNNLSGYRFILIAVSTARDKNEPMTSNCHIFDVWHSQLAS